MLANARENEAESAAQPEQLHAPKRELAAV